MDWERERRLIINWPKGSYCRDENVPKLIYGSGYTTW